MSIPTDNEILKAAGVTEITVKELWNINDDGSINNLMRYIRVLMGPLAIRLPCPACGELHIDEGEFATKPHHTHACQHCGNVWRPAVVDTVGVKFLPGYKND